MCVMAYTSIRTFSTTNARNKLNIIVFGGNGYVGSSIIKNLVQHFETKHDLDVKSISRSGTFQSCEASSSWVKKVDWVKGNILEPDSYKHYLQNADCVISCVGAFGSNEFMEKINGDANITAISQSLNAGAKCFVYVSTVDNTLPEAVLKGYFHGKRRAEEALLSAYPDTGVVLRPGFMYGTRYVNNIGIPLWLLGKPLEAFLSLPGANNLKQLPGMRAIFSRPLDVNVVGQVAADIAVHGLKEQYVQAKTHILSEDDIYEYLK